MIPSTGLDRGYSVGITKRLIYCHTYKEDGSLNRILKSDLTTKAALQVLFNVRSYATDTSTRMVCTPQVREYLNTPTEPTNWEVEDYKEELQPSRADVSYSHIGLSPYTVKYMETYKNFTMSYYKITELNYIEGMDDGTYLTPFPIQPGSFTTPQYDERGFTKGSQTKIMFRRATGIDINRTQAIKIADASYNLDSDFYSLIPATGVVTSPAVTGCVITLTCNDEAPADPLTPIYVTGVVFGDITFTNTSSGAVETLAGAGSISQVGGAVTVNEAALLTSGQTYRPKIDMDRFDITCGLVVVP